MEKTIKNDAVVLWPEKMKVKDKHMLRNIEKVVMDNEVLLSVTTDTDFEYAYREQDICRIKAKSGRIIVGRLHSIETSSIELDVENVGIIKLAYSAIREIEEFKEKELL